MAKRLSQDIKNKKSRSKKTAKRLTTKRERIAKKGARIGKKR